MPDAFRDSAAVPLDDIDEMKVGIKENADSLSHLRETVHVLAESMQVFAKRQGDTDRGNLEILKRVDENTVLTKQNIDATAGLVEIAKAFDGLLKLLELVSRWAKPATVILLFIAAAIGVWAAWVKLNS